jgi:pimeloyl-ACP methyl ester carboxylesterase
MVIPGFLATDRSTLGLQRALAEAGYRVTGWGLGVNRGATSDMLDRMTHAVADFGRGRPVVLVGWSLGGVYARELAKARPDLVAKVVTMGTPFSGNPRANNVWQLYELIAGHRSRQPAGRSERGSEAAGPDHRPLVAPRRRHRSRLRARPPGAKRPPGGGELQPHGIRGQLGRPWPAVIDAVRG